VRNRCPEVRRVVDDQRLREWLAGCEPSDWVLIVDPSCVPGEGLEHQLFPYQAARDPRWARHLVAFDVSTAGTLERLETDANGRVRRIQRHYDTLTWPFATGVACSLLPVSCCSVAEELPFSPLANLRRALATTGVPSRDLPLRGVAVDLTQEEGFLAFSEEILLATFERRPPGMNGAPLLVGGGQRIHATASVHGPVVLHEDVEVGEDALLLGPVVLGPGARIGSRTIIAQGVVGAEVQVPAQWTLRHRGIFETLSGSPPAIRDTQAEPYRRAPPQLRRASPAAEGRRDPYRTIKPILEGVAAALALVLLAPLLALVALWIKLDSPGPVLYGDTREGKDGRPFRCWKFRTMHSKANLLQRELATENEMDGPQFKLIIDPRITRIGRWLRPTSIDELPQLLNVALGQMSLVGPRPSPFRENQVCVPWRQARLSLRPGITGLWQVCRHDRLQGDFHQWIQYDLLYVRHASFEVDLKILAATFWTLGGKTNVPVEWIVPEAAEAQPASVLSEQTG